MTRLRPYRREGSKDEHLGVLLSRAGHGAGVSSLSYRAIRSLVTMRIHPSILVRMPAWDHSMQHVMTLPFEVTE